MNSPFRPKLQHCGQGRIFYSFVLNQVNQQASDGNRPDGHGSITSTCPARQLQFAVIKPLLKFRYGIPPTSFSEWHSSGGGLLMDDDMTSCRGRQSRDWKSLLADR